MNGLLLTHLSVLIYRKIDINYVRERLGDSKIDTNYKHYSRVIMELREDVKQTIETFENL